jgi:predicted membrane metal-binding protein
MSTKDFIKKSVLNAFTQYDAPKLAVALLAALAAVVVLDPFAVLSVGFWLSFLSRLIWNYINY